MILTMMLTLMMRSDEDADDDDHHDDGQTTMDKLFSIYIIGNLMVLDSQSRHRRSCRHLRTSNLYACSGAVRCRVVLVLWRSMSAE